MSSIISRCFRSTAQTRPSKSLRVTRRNLSMGAFFRMLKMSDLSWARHIRRGRQMRTRQLSARLRRTLDVERREHRTVVAGAEIAQHFTGFRAFRKRRRGEHVIEAP